MEKIRLLQVIPSLNSGGAEKGTLDIAKGICNSGNASFVTSNGGRLLSYLLKTGTKHIKLPVHSKNPLVMYKNIWKIKNIINENKINIVHTRSRAPAWTVYYAKKNKKIKLVSTFHNVYNSTNLVKKFYNSGLGRADSIIAISNFVKNKIIKLYNIPEKKITVIYRGIDQKQFDIKTINEELFVKFIRNNNISDYKKIILYPARLTAWKGQIEFLKVLKKLDHKKYFCLFAGDDKNSSYLKKLTSEINNYGLGSSCKIMGHVTDMNYLYKLSHLVINASVEPEGFGRVVAEAMLMGKPVIAFDHGGVSEQISIYDDNLKIPFNNYEKMAKTINNILNMPMEPLEKIGQISSSFVKKKFDKEKMISKTINVYERLLTRK